MTLFSFKRLVNPDPNLWGCSGPVVKFGEVYGNESLCVKNKSCVFRY